MALVSVTRLKLRSFRYLPEFLWHSLTSVRQLRRAPGFRGGGMGRDPAGGFWTISLWDDLSSMRAYRNSDAHGKAMPKLIRWCSEASVADWNQDTAELPTGAEALARMRECGRVSKLRHPSPAHQARETAPTGGPPMFGLVKPMPGP